MSLEQALAANTAALQALTAALSASAVVRPSPAPSEQPAPSVAPFTAAAAPLPTAPVEQPDTSPAPTIAFAPAAPTAPSPAPTAAPLTAPPAGSGDGERDSKGMPWDGRIHASTKAKVADGSWRYKRGVEDATVAQVEGELRAALAAPAVTPAFGPHPFYDAQQPAAPAAAPAVAPPPVVASTPAPAVAVPAAPVAGSIQTYAQLMVALPPKIVSGELTATSLQQACESVGVPSVAALSARSDLIPAVVALLKL